MASSENEPQQTWGAPPVHAPRRWSARMTAVAALVGVGIAGASGLAVWAGTGADAGNQADGSGMAGRPGMGRMQDGALGGGPGTMPAGTNALHGEYVVPSGDGYETQLVQTGSVTKVEADSLTARSEDGYTMTYEIDSETEIESDSGEVTDLAKGMAVTVVATEQGDSPVATSVAAADSTTDRGGMPPGGTPRGGTPQGGMPQGGMPQGGPRQGGTAG